MRDPTDMTDYRHLEHKPALYRCDYTTRDKDKDKDKDKSTGTVHSLYIVSSLSLEAAMVLGELVPDPQEVSIHHIMDIDAIDNEIEACLHQLAARAAKGE